MSLSHLALVKAQDGDCGAATGPVAVKVAAGSELSEAIRLTGPIFHSWKSTKMKIQI